MTNLHKRKPSAVRVDEHTAVVKDWRDVYVGLVSKVVAHGKGSELPPEWFTHIRLGPDAPDAVASVGVRDDRRLLITCLSRPQLVRNASKCAEVLRAGGVTDVVVTFRDGTSTPLAPAPAPHGGGNMPDLHKLTPAAVRVDERTRVTRGWDGVLVTLVALAEELAPGRFDDLPAKWFTTHEKHERAKAASVGGKWLVTSVNREKLFERASRCAAILRDAGVKDVSVTFREATTASLPEPTPLSNALHALLPQPDPVPVSVTVGTVVYEVYSGWKGALRVLVEAADLHNRLDALPAAWFRTSESPAAMRVLRLDIPVDELIRRFDVVACALRPIPVSVTYDDGRTLEIKPPPTPLSDRLPESILVGSESADVTNWREAYVFVVAQAVEHGLALDLPREWFVLVPSGNSHEVLVGEGIRIHTAERPDVLRVRMETLADALAGVGRCVTVKFTDGSTHTYPLSRVAMTANDSASARAIDGDILRRYDRVLTQQQQDDLFARAIYDGIKDKPGVRRALKALLDRENP